MEQELIKNESDKILNIFSLLKETKVDEIYKKYYSDIRIDYFFDIIKSDPTTPFKKETPQKLGQYSKWLLTIFRNKNLKLEDLYKAKEYLSFYNELKNKHLIPSDKKDIGGIKTLHELFELTKKIGGTGEPKEDENFLITDKYYLNTGQAEIFFENKRWLIITPKTIEASKFYDYNSQWCTRYPENFNGYTKDGPLYVIIDKLKLNTESITRRLQFHFESNQFMNLSDAPIDYILFYKNNPSILGVFKLVIIKNLLNDYNSFNQQFFDIIPDLRKIESQIKAKLGIEIEECFFDLLESQEKIFAIDKRLEITNGEPFSLNYFKKSNFKQKVKYFQSIAIRGKELPKEIFENSPTELIKYYAQEVIENSKKLPDYIYEVLDSELQQKYIKKSLCGRFENLSENQFCFLSDEEKQKWLSKFLKTKFYFISDKIFFALNTECKNKYIAFMAEKFGFSEVEGYITKKQYNWASTEGFL